LLTRVDLTSEEKRQALERVLKSETFARSEQLKRFLRYICESEIQGRAQEITEYSIAVEALGRPQDYSPNEDSSVRNRAYALRRKLEEYYSSEGCGDRVKIHLPKGSYVPRFVEVATPPAVLPETAAAVAEPSEILYRRASDWRSWRAPWAGILTAVLLTAAVTYVLTRSPDPVDPVLREAWGPILGPQANTVLLIGTPPHMFIRPYPEGRQPTRTRLFELPPEAYAAYRGALGSGHKLYMLFTYNSPLWGDSAGMAIAARLFAMAGAPFEILPERLVSSISALRDRNLVVFGTPEYSEKAAHLLERTPLALGFDEELREHVVIDRRRTGGVSRLAPDRDNKNLMVHTWGLITVLPSEGTTGVPKRTIVFSGISSAGTQAAAEYFTSPVHLRQLKERFLADKQPGFPTAYQVVVETDISHTIPLKVRYKTHVAIPEVR